MRLSILTGAVMATLLASFAADALRALAPSVEPLFQELVELHYDPLYARSQGTNFAQLA